MDTSIRFEFEGRAFVADAFFSFDQQPYYIFMSLHDSTLIEYFGEEVTIKTDLFRVLPKKDDYPNLIELRQKMFNAIKSSQVFRLKKEQVLGFACA